KPKEKAKRLSLPDLYEVNVLNKGASRLERLARRIPLFDVYAIVSGFAVADTVKALRFQAILANNMIYAMKKSLNPYLRGFCANVLSEHVREKTGKPNWDRVARLIEEFGGKQDDLVATLKQLQYTFRHSPAATFFD